MGFAWKPDDRGEAFGDLYRDTYRIGRRFYRTAAVWARLRGLGGRHAVSHSQRQLLVGFAVASRKPLGRSQGALSDSRREDHGHGGAGRGAHAARRADVPRRRSGRSGPERWRRWA